MDTFRTLRTLCETLFPLSTFFWKTRKLSQTFVPIPQNCRTLFRTLFWTLFHDFSKSFTRLEWPIIMLDPVMMPLPLAATSASCLGGALTKPRMPARHPATPRHCRLPPAACRRPLCVPRMPCSAHVGGGRRRSWGGSLLLTVFWIRDLLS